MRLRPSPRWLDRIHLKGAVVTMDAAGCQTAIVQALREAGADYVLAVKRNQPTLHREVKAAFDDAERGVFRPADSAPSATTSRAGLRMRKPCWSWSAATGGWRTACTAPWTCNSGRTTAACAAATPPPSWASCAEPP
ncbi:MAG: transposase [Caldilineaceae bacterium SB0664_bin_22]|nr:transposase [Caldilineaceae bacterium SB0664_bin_22]